MVGTDGDERAAACSGDDAIDGQFGVDDDLVAARLDRPGAQLDGAIDRCGAAQSDRIVGGHATRRVVEATLAHQVHRGRPVGVAVEERADDPAVQDPVEGGVVGEWLPLGPQFARSVVGFVAFDPQALLVRRAAAEAARRGAVASLEARLGHDRESSPSAIATFDRP